MAKKIEKKGSQKSESKSCCDQHNHPDHQSELVKLRRAKGQIEGIEKMISDRRYCPEILVQIRAARQALKSIENSILKTHLKNCVEEAMHSKNEKEVSQKINELIEVFSRHQG